LVPIFIFSTPSPASGRDVLEKQLPAWIAITVAKENFQDLYDVHNNTLSLSTMLGSILKLEMRSASRSNITAAAEAGNQSVYTVTFSVV
jgi:hypothetical protein